jgi:hypothetical protein
MKRVPDTELNNPMFQLYCWYHIKLEAYNQTLTDIRDPRDHNAAYLTTVPMHKKSDKYQATLFAFVVHTALEKRFKIRTSNTSLLKVADWLYYYNLLDSNGELAWIKFEAGRYEL